MSSQKSAELSQPLATRQTNTPQPSKPTNEQEASTENPAGKKVGKWTPEEDELLRKYVTVFSEKQWKKVSENIQGRTPIQCLHRWTKILKPGLVKGPWTQEEDQKLLDWVKKEGPGKWAQAANLIPGRSGKQCRERWFNNLNPDVKKGNWSQAEDEQIFQLYQKYGSSWSKIAKYISGRTENSIKNRFYSTLRKVAAAKHKIPVTSLDPEHIRMDQDVQNIAESSKQDNKSANEEATSDQDAGVLYNLLNASDSKISIENESDDERKEKEEMKIKEEHHGHKEVKKEAEENRSRRKDISVKEKDKIVDKPASTAGQSSILEANKPLINPNANLLRDTVSKLLQVNIDENDPNFEKYLLGLKEEWYGNLIRNPLSTESLQNLEDLDLLQNKILTFSNNSITNLTQPSKNPSNEEQILRIAQQIRDLQNLQRTQLLLPNLQAQLQALALVQPQTDLSSQLLSSLNPEALLQDKQGFRRSQNPNLLNLPLGNLAPLMPTALKIPTLDTSLGNITKIPKLASVSDKDLSSAISPYPTHRTRSERSEDDLKNRVLSEKKNVENIQVADLRKKLLEGLGGGGGQDKQKNEGNIAEMLKKFGNLPNIPLNLANLNESMKTEEETGSQEAKEKIESLFQQVTALEGWIKNAKSELLKLEDFVEKHQDVSKSTTSIINPKSGMIHERNKGKFTDENTALEGSEEQISKKRKI